MTSQKEILTGIARQGGAVIMHSFATIALFPDGRMKVISSYMAPAKEDKLYSKRTVAKKKESKPFTVEHNEIEL